MFFPSFSKKNLSWLVVQEVLELGAKVPGKRQVPFALTSLKLTPGRAGAPSVGPGEEGESLLRDRSTRSHV